MNKAAKITEEARKFLTNPNGLNLQENDVLHFFLRHVSRLGLRRVYDVYIVRGKDLVRITHSVAAVCGYRYDAKKQGLIVDGYGFSAANEIAQRLWPLVTNDGMIPPYGMPYHDHM